MLEQLGITRVTIDLPFRLNHVHCFLAPGNEGLSIMDTGLHNEQAINTWKQYIGAQKVSHIYITHYHPDHFGYAGGLQKETGADVWMTETDAKLGMKSWDSEWLDQLFDQYLSLGIPEEKARSMSVNTEGFVDLVSPLPNVSGYLEEGALIKFGHYEYEVIFTPGHSDGLVCFYNQDKKVLMSTDHILPRITPNISYWFHGHQDPLASYLSSLKKIKKLEIDVAIPCHGEPFHHVHERIEEIEDHHAERLDQTLAIIKEPKTAYEVCGQMFRPNLTVHEIRFAIGETLAHLQYLLNKGECEQTRIDGKLIWRAS